MVQIDHYHSLERSRNEVRIDEADVPGDEDPDEDFLKKERSRRIKEALARLLPLLAEKPPPSHVFEQVALMAAEGSAEYF